MTAQPADTESESAERPGRGSGVTRLRRRHEATTHEIKQVSLRMLREGEPLNLRAVARQMELTPSALYRYFASRDAIVTALIVDAYDDVGSHVEGIQAELADADPGSRILAVLHGFRDWALAHPHEYGLIYGTPMAGYEPDEATQASALRTHIVLIGELARALEEGAVVPRVQPVPDPLEGVLTALRDVDGVLHDLPATVWAGALQFWTVLYGAVNAELFGHYPPPIRENPGEFFDHTMRGALLALGTRPEVLDVVPRWGEESGNA